MTEDGAAIQNFVQITEGDELVRHSDVEKLIENKIEDKTHNVSKLKGKWQIVLEELLEETQK